MAQFGQTANSGKRPGCSKPFPIRNDGDHCVQSMEITTGVTAKGLNLSMELQVLNTYKRLMDESENQLRFLIT